MELPRFRGIAACLNASTKPLRGYMVGFEVSVFRLGLGVRALRFRAQGLGLGGLDSGLGFWV